MSSPSFNLARTRPARGVVSTVLVILCAVLLTACNASDAKIAASKLNVTNPRLVTVQETGERSFSATIINENKRPISIVQVEVALYDASGARAGKTMIEVENVPANGKKDFKSVIDVGYDVARAKVSSAYAP